MSSVNREVKSVMHQVKARNLTVKKIEQLTPRMKRITFTGEDLKDFVSLSPDDHVKVFFPYPGEEKAVVPVFTPNGPSVEGGRKPLMRDYTPRRFDSINLELDIDFVLHGEGVGSQWASHAQVGQNLTIGGPRGSRVVPYNFDWYLMIGDETALPSFERRLTELPADSKAVVFIEVEDESQKISLPESTQYKIHWIYRQGRKAGDPAGFRNELLKVGFPVGEYFAWIACEKQCAMQIRDFLLTVRGANEEWIKATGYWSIHSDGSHK